MIGKTTRMTIPHSIGLRKPTNAYLDPALGAVQRVFSKGILQ